MSLSFLDLLFPKRCVSCNRLGSYLCHQCLSKIKFVEYQICPTCQRPSITGATHPKCQTKYSLDGLISITKFEGPIRIAIHKLKYKWISDLGETLVSLILDNLWKQKALPADKFTVVPVPLAPKREHWRGFNQAALLGKIIAQKLEFDFSDSLIIKIKETKPQVELKARERRDNVAGVFKVGVKEEAEDGNFLLVDDMTTTGATLRSCGLVLKRTGALKVWALTLARSR